MKLFIDPQSVREFTSKKTGQVYSKQKGYLQKDGDRSVIERWWFVGPDQPALPVGEYAVKADWFGLDRRGFLDFRPELPVSAASADKSVKAA